ncbi:hypothetical protein [Enterobacter sp. R1(2018)]|uniref:hypothetical protein n=1 Tax=Enterobacter sp. R1(2018) TaxID=2447891 RepID=UPI000EB53A65|nr:hypothetical protein [Enterobacter sp. R1(2018)]RKQ41172.1 hypothetical protein D8M09_02150 [Enterobacter sp. R1(2018)]
MANTNSTTITHSEILCTQPGTEPAIATLLKTPINVTMDLFQVLDCCESLADALIENDSNTERMALYGRLYAGLEALKVVLKAPLPEYLIDRLTADLAKEDDYRSPLTTDSESLREYCAALTMLLLQGQQSPVQEKHITGLVFELFGILAEDLKAPRFIRTDAGLMMINAEATNEIH